MVGDALRPSSTVQRWCRVLVVLTAESPRRTFARPDHGWDPTRRRPLGAQSDCFQQVNTVRPPKGRSPPAGVELLPCVDAASRWLVESHVSYPDAVWRSITLETRGFIFWTLNLTPQKETCRPTTTTPLDLRRCYLLYFFFAQKGRRRCDFLCFHFLLI